MGYLYEHTCYSTSASAADAFFSGQAPYIYYDKKQYQVQFEKSSTLQLWQIVTYELPTNGSPIKISTTSTAVPSFSDCDPNGGFIDGLALGGLLIPVLLAVASFSLLKRVAR